MAEVLGVWPDLVGVIVICLLPKPDGGRRPIGLLPGIIRLWMRARLNVARSWQTEHDRPYFYAGPGRGASAAAWRQAARAELAQTSRYLCFAGSYLDMVKAFERVPHDWLVKQAAKHGYSLIVLRLSIQAYRLGRAVGINGVFSTLYWASRSITAGSVHATIELRVLLIEWLDEIVYSFAITPTVYVDDTSFEAVGTERMVVSAVVGATNMFAGFMAAMDLELSAKKNLCNASSTKIALEIVGNLKGVKVRVDGRIKSLGGALGAGKLRNAMVQRKRLEQFKVRRDRFRKLRKSVGAARTHMVLRTGGVAALTYGQSTMGVSNSMLLAQRRAVGAAGFLGGPGDLDLSLAVADGSTSGKADPAFVAHLDPIGDWASAIWEGWFPRVALKAMCNNALVRLEAAKLKDSIWSVVRGPAAAFVASAWRLGWVIHDHLTVTTDDKTIRLDLARDSPAYVKKLVEESVRRWRWRKVEAKVPSLDSGGAGFGPHIAPLYDLMKKQTHQWSFKEIGALKSVVTNRQWPQVRLCRAGMAQSKNCRLCVGLGLCDPEDPDPRFTGTLTHRHWTCTALKDYRQQHVPKWLLDEVEGMLQGGFTLPPKQEAVFNRALAPSVKNFTCMASRRESFQWVKRPPHDAATVKGVFYTDASRLFGHKAYFGECTSYGWAFAAYDQSLELIAAAMGCPPSWVKDIHPSELWALLQAVTSSEPGSSYISDCLAAVEGCHRGSLWANAAQRTYSRGWNPLSSALDGREQAKEAVKWMPAHCSKTAVGIKKLSDGRPMTSHDLQANAFVDRLCKEAAAKAAMPEPMRNKVAEQSNKLTCIARWLGQVTVIANHYPAGLGPNGKSMFLRDSEARKRPKVSGQKRKAEEQLAPATLLTQNDSSSSLEHIKCPRLRAVHARVLARLATEAAEFRRL